MWKTQTLFIHNCSRFLSFSTPLISSLYSFTLDSSPSVIQQRAGVSWCWLLPAFHCGPVTALFSLPLSSLSLSGVVLLNNLFRMTQIAVRGWLTNARIFHCRTVFFMEKHQLLIVPSFSSFSEKHCKSVCAAVVSRFQVPDESTRPPSLTTSCGLTLFEKKKAMSVFWGGFAFQCCWECCPDLWFPPTPQATSMPSCRRRSSSSQSPWSTQWEGGSTLTTTQVRLGCEEEFFFTYCCYCKQL